ncbi:MAG: hypothetical protein GY810_18720 [Aureispira sp.]|nr:hypothetical protein [Aureispira sp.]
MSFVYPWFLWALLTLSIPIIIHLFYFRRFKTVYFTNVKFLQEVKEQTDSRSKIKHFLVLLARLSALTFLVLAFAQPFIPNKNNNSNAGSKDVSIFFDNSFSMAAESEDVRLLEKARKRAEDIVAAYSNDDRIQILTTDFEGRDQRLLSKEDALSRVREVRTSYQVKSLSKVLARQKQALSTGKASNKEIYIISDFQKNITDLVSYKDTTYKLNLVPLQAVQSQNAAIDTAWFESPVQSTNQPNPLIVKVQNFTNKELSEVRLTLTLEGQTRPIKTLTIPAKTSLYDTVNVSILNTGWHEAKLSITDYPIEFDNNYFFTFYVDEKVDVLEIFGTNNNPYIQATFKENDYFNVISKPSGQLDYSKLPDYDLVILNELKTIPSGLIGELHNYTINGGNIVVFPHLEAKLEDYKKLTQLFNANNLSSLSRGEQKVSYINMNEFVFNDVFMERRDNIKLPITTSNFKIARRASSSEEVILRYRNGGTFMGKNAVGKGNFYLCAAPLDIDHSNLVQNGEIFVPMLYRMALSQGFQQKIAYTIGKDNVLETDNRVSSSEMVYKIKNDKGEFIPEQRPMGSRVILGINNQIELAGFYDLFLNAEEVLDKYAYNYDRKESQLELFTQDELTLLIGENANIIDGNYTTDFVDVITTQSKGTPLWKWCLILTLIFLAIETILLRIWKT